MEDDNEARSSDRHGSQSDVDDDHGGTSGGWVTLNSKPGVYDILKFRNGLDTLLSVGSFQTVGSIKKVRLTLGNNNKVVYNGLTSALTLKKNFLVISLEEQMSNFNSTDRINLWLDFDGNQSVRNHGNQFELEPRIKAFTKDQTGSIEGRVVPADARAIVMAINGTDTATAKPEREGEFKIIGLKAGNYKIVFHATANNYVDASLSNIVVRNREDSHAGTIMLHK